MFFLAGDIYLLETIYFFIKARSATRITYFRSTLLISWGLDGDFRFRLAPRALSWRNLFCFKKKSVCGPKSRIFSEVCELSSLVLLETAGNCAGAVLQNGLVFSLICSAWIIHRAAI